jgi:membrane associated rhomboid family serine protease
MNITIWIIVITAVISIWAFQRRDIFEKLLLSPYMVVQRKEWYRLITHGFLHVDWIHLIVNMLVLYSFGSYIEGMFAMCSPNYWVFHFLALYFGGMIVASIPSIVKYKNHYGYRSVGASGAVSAVLFAFIFFAPWGKLLFMAIVPVPGIIFGVLYLAYSSYMSKKGGDNINHDAHFFGAVYGFLYPIVINPHLLSNFIDKLMHP